jgi:7-methyl-GTP pyrophosphatase
MPHTMPQTSLILASTSPYRRDLLTRLGLPFEVDAPAVDEAVGSDESADALVTRLARAKAEAVAARHTGAIVIGSDQVAVRDRDILGKPEDEETAVAQLMASSGHSVRFLTGLCVVGATGDVHEHTDETVVRFRALDEAEVRRYVAAERPLDCAGAFKVEGLGISLFETVETVDPTALIGLPLIALCATLRELGAAPLQV